MVVIIISLFKHRYVNKISKTKRQKKEYKVKTINKSIKPSRCLEDIIERRYIFISVLVVFCFLIIGIKLFNYDII